VSADTSQIIHANSSGEINEAATTLLAQATRKVLLFGPRLDLPVFDSNDTYEHLARLVAGDRHNQIRVLIGDERFFLAHNRRLLQLCQRFSSYVKARRIPSEIDAAGDLFIVVDDHAYLHQSHFDTPVAVVNLDARGKATLFTRRFEELWEHSEPIAEISTLGLVGH
jgi:hypothetical protein